MLYFTKILTIRAGLWLSVRLPYPHSMWKALGSTTSNEKKNTHVKMLIECNKADNEEF